VTLLADWSYLFTVQIVVRVPTVARNKENGLFHVAVRNLKYSTLCNKVVIMTKWRTVAQLESIFLWIYCLEGCGRKVPWFLIEIRIRSLAIMKDGGLKRVECFLISLKYRQRFRISPKNRVADYCDTSFFIFLPF